MDLAATARKGHVMMWKRLCAHGRGGALVLLLLVSCATPQATTTPVASPVTLPPTTTPTEIAATPAPETATRTPLPSPVSPEFPIGTFFHQHPEGYFCVYQFNQDGTLAYYWLAWSLDVSGSKPYSTGTYRIDGSQFIFTSIDMPDCSSPATYLWTYDGRNLALQAIGEDSCPDRQRIYEKGMVNTKAK